MKPCIKNPFLLPTLIAGLISILAGRVTAQTFTTLYSFTAFNYNHTPPTNFDGCTPSAVIISGNSLYGTTYGGGSQSDGTVFKVSTNGTRFQILHMFTFDTNGSSPNAGLTLSGNTLYGTARWGGNGIVYGYNWGNGTVFAVNTDGTGFRTVHRFTVGNYNSSNLYTNSDGACSCAGLILSGNTLYGTAPGGGIYGMGTVFAVNTDGTGFKTLHSFTANSSYTNSDGANPYSGLLISGNTLYGMASAGGTYGGGAVFAVNTDGTGFTTLHSFNNSDGAYPHSGLLISGNTLYGTTPEDGPNGWGTIFAVNTNGMGYRTLYSFNNGDNPYPSAFAGRLILSGNSIYGTTYGGGIYGMGTVFAVNTDGTGFKTLHSFTATSSYTNSDGTSSYTNSDGTSPYASLALSGNTLYGTALDGGTYGSGTVFSLSLSLPAPVILSAPQITVGKTNFTFMLSGPAGSNYVLQASTNLLNWDPISTSAIPVSGTINVTNSITNYNRRFYKVHLQ